MRTALIYKVNMNKIFTRGLALAVALTLCQSSQSGAATPGRSFSTPREAVTALERAASSASLAELRAIFGSGLDEIANPDRVQATNEVAAFAAALRETNRLVSVPGGRRIIIEYGPEGIPFPVPLVNNGQNWVFDTEAGAEELLNRRIGRNELAVLDIVRTYVQAQREYAGMDRDGDQVLEYAQNFASTPGTKDGLFWSPDLDGTISPLGPLVADAQEAGYRKSSDGGRHPFHGYYFRILTRQGKHAAGGAYDYIINKNMIGGFALVAWPAEYDETGVMTFIVNQQGRVYQKDLGSKTSKLVGSMKEYSPDGTWAVSPD